MIIEKNLKSYIVSPQETLSAALSKIVQTRGRILLVVEESGILQGLFTNGDFLRWLTKQAHVDLRQPVSTIMNRNFRYVTTSDPTEKIRKHLDDVLFVPVVDNYGRLVAVARRRKPGEGVNIGGFGIDSMSPVFIIAEIGNNHNGSLDLAKQLIEKAAEAGANCAKFQMRDMQTLYLNQGIPDDSKENLGTQYTLDLLSRFQLTPDELFQAFEFCTQMGIIPLCTPWDHTSIATLEEFGMPAYKVASADLTNHDMLTRLAETGKPIICSTGMSTEQEIIESVNHLKQHGVQYVLLHCNSTYPPPFKDINLNYIERLQEIGECPVGYSGHERGINIPIAAVAKGAKIVEKHLTLDRGMEGNDHKVSLLPGEFARMVEGIRQVEQALGTAAERKMSQGEMLNRVTLAKSLICACDLEPGDIIQADMIEIKSPGQGLQPNRKAELIGKKAKRQIKKGDFFYPSDLEPDMIRARNYKLDRPWGVPVRYHDYREILAKTNPDLLEFHLSYKDLEVDIDEYFNDGETFDLNLVVHSPELFAGDHVLDLCSKDIAYRRHSIEELQRVVKVAQTLKRYFRRASRPLIVTNVGGFSENAPLSKDEVAELYSILIDSLNQIETEGVEIIPQTMPPFPWHFGGQRFHNLFVDPGEIADFCNKHNYRICLDISHSKLACNHRHSSFTSFVKELGPYVAHIHMADAEGLDGEGLQIGKGDIDFVSLASVLKRYAPNASMIPEIWQGHENGGEGFWIALERLEEIFGG